MGNITALLAGYPIVDLGRTLASQLFLEKLHGYKV
jgi:hypothetical protein